MRGNRARELKFVAVQGTGGVTLIQEYRLRAGYTQQELGSAIGCTGQTVSNLENGKPARGSTARKVAKHFGREVMDLFKLEKGA